MADKFCRTTISDFANCKVSYKVIFKSAEKSVCFVPFSDATLNGFYEDEDGNIYISLFCDEYSSFLDGMYIRGTRFILSLEKDKVCLPYSKQEFDEKTCEYGICGYMLKTTYNFNPEKMDVLEMTSEENEFEPGKFNNKELKPLNVRSKEICFSELSTKFGRHREYKLSSIGGNYKIKFNKSTIFMIDDEEGYLQFGDGYSKCHYIRDNIILIENCGDVASCVLFIVD